MGVAVLEGSALIYHGVEVFTRPRSRHQILSDGRTRMLRLMADFRPEAVVMEKVLFANNQRTAILTVFVAEIVATIKRNRVPLVQLAPSSVKKIVCGNGHADKGEVARSVVAHFPELSAYLRQDRKWKNSFQANRFDAVAVGLSVLGTVCSKAKAR